MDETHSNGTAVAAPAGAALIRALAAGDLAAARDLLDEGVAFSALLPRRVVVLDSRDAVLDLFAGWLPAGGIDELEVLEEDMVVDRRRVGYRVRWHDPAGGRFLFEQQAYYDVGEAGIRWMHLVCTGHRPLPTLGE